jgi:hypothetical protein
METNDLPFSTIMIELDVLFDTRLSVLASMGDEAIKAAYSNRYHERPIDMFSGVNNEEFKERYDNRTKSILKHTMVTPIAEMVKEFAVKTLKHIVSTPFHYRPKCIINIYPYDLSEKEISILISTMVHVTDKLCDIEVVNMKPEEVTPSFVKTNVAILILYEYYKWLELHSVNGLFKRKTCPEVTLLGPRIYFKPKENTNNEADPFDAMEEVMGPLIGLKLIPIENFSAVIRKPT